MNENKSIENKIEKIEFPTSLWEWQKEKCIDDDTYFICSDATKWNSIEDFYHEVYLKFKVSKMEKSYDPRFIFDAYIHNIDSLNDRLRNLRWIKRQKIVWLIKDLSIFDKFDDIYESLSSYILPFWEGRNPLNSVINVDSVLPSKDRRKPKHFLVYYS